MEKRWYLVKAESLFGNKWGYRGYEIFKANNVEDVKKCIDVLEEETDLFFDEEVKDVTEWVLSNNLMQDRRLKCIEA